MESYWVRLLNKLLTIYALKAVGFCKQGILVVNRNLFTDLTKSNSHALNKNQLRSYKVHLLSRFN